MSQFPSDSGSSELYVTGTVLARALREPRTMIWRFQGTECQFPLHSWLEGLCSSRASQVSALGPWGGGEDLQWFPDLPGLA